MRRLACLLVLCACSSGAPEASGPTDHLIVAAYTAPREAMEDGIIPAFRAAHRARTGRDVIVHSSYQGSGAQARAVIAGFEADVVLLALAGDVDKIAKAGLVAADWRAHAGQDGTVARTLVVLAVRKGNPLGITDFADLRRPGIEVLCPNPRTSGGAMWNVLAIYGSAGNDLTAVRDVFANVVVMDKGARESVINFERGIGDVAITYEQEVVAARLAGRDYDAVVPSPTMIIDVPAAVVRRPNSEDNPAAAELIAFLTSPEGQEILHHYGFRRLDAPLPPGFGIDRFGGWPRAQKELFGQSGTLTRVIEEGQETR